MTAIDDAVDSTPAEAEFVFRPRSARAHVNALQPDSGLPPVYTPTEAAQPVHRSS
jgi:hypothetical protein